MNNQKILVLIVILCLSSLFSNAFKAVEIPSKGKVMELKVPMANIKLTGKEKSAGSVEGVRVKDIKVKEAVRITMEKRVKSPWWLHYQAKLSGPVKKGDLLLITFKARCVSSEDESGAGKLTVVLKNNSVKGKPNFMKPISLGSSWKHYLYPVNAHSEGEGKWMLMLQLGGAKPQVLDIADITVINYQDKRTMDELPRSKTEYPGMASDAPWRKEAAERIDKYRKENLKLTIVDAAGKPVPGAKVSVELKNHAFGWGTAINAKKMFGTIISEKEKEQYQKAVLKSFNKVVFENGLKWKLYKNQAKEVEAAVEWIKESKIPARGHVLVWPAFKRIPKELHSLKDDPKKLKKTIEEHVTEFSTKWPGVFQEWDVMNEPYSQHEFMDILGKEVTVDWFKLAEKADPTFVRYINDFGILAGDSVDHQDNYYEWISYLIDNGAPLQGIGFQGHFRAPLPPQTIYNRIERYASFGLDMQITEYDFDDTDQDLKAQFTRDFMTIVFSHPKMVGFVIWTIWSKKTAKPNAAFYDDNWKPRKSMLAWDDMIKNVWHTSEDVTTAQNGSAVVRGFLGTYRIVVSKGGKKKAYSYNLKKGKGAVKLPLK
jgi:GH35 family endo-1,4-beta-xylanase